MEKVTGESSELDASLDHNHEEVSNQSLMVSVDGEHSAKLFCRQIYPRLPMELIVTIAEFLIGDFAFGTTANLNLTCHTVREETLAVLYETLCLDRVNDRVNIKDYLMSNRANSGLKFTKYVDCWISVINCILTTDLRFLLCDDDQ
jgi:hypothetical protein